MLIVEMEREINDIKHKILFDNLDCIKVASLHIVLIILQEDIIRKLKCELRKAA